MDQHSNNPRSIIEKPKKTKLLGKRKATHISRKLNSTPHQVEMGDLYDQYESLWVETM